MLYWQGTVSNYGTHTTGEGQAAIAPRYRFLDQPGSLEDLDNEEQSKLALEG